MTYAPVVQAKNTKNVAQIRQLSTTRREMAVKTEQEIEGMRVACRFNAQLMNYIRPLVKAGISTEEIAQQYMNIPLTMVTFCTPNYYGFPKSVCTSVNEVVCHGIPTEIKF